VRFGELSSRLIYWEAKRRIGHNCQTFIRRLFWRDLAYWTLWKFPSCHTEPLRPQYAHQRWGTDAAALKKWQRGRTGFPLVDAAMRQLWAIGWMPNYLRHVVAGFLVEYMNMHWFEGFKWFDYTLVDSDVAINAYMWQNGGHSGLDQWNFVMHPVYAAKSCDPEGNYVRQWVPELRHLPVEYVHCPWEAPVTLLASARVLLGRDYYRRTIDDLLAARRNSHKAVIEVREGVGKPYVLACGNEKMQLPDGRWVRLITRIDYRMMAANPVTVQTAADAWNKSKRRLLDQMSLALADEQRIYHQSHPDADEEEKADL